MMPTLEKAMVNARKDRVYARRVGDALYRVSSRTSRLEHLRYEVRRWKDGWKCTCAYSLNGGLSWGVCKHVARVIEREQKTGALLPRQTARETEREKPTLLMKEEAELDYEEEARWDGRITDEIEARHRARAAWAAAAFGPEE